MDYGNSHKKGYMRVAGWYMVDVEFPDLSNKLDGVIIDTIINGSTALPHATSPEEITAILDILLSNMQELYRRAQEHVDA